MYFARLILAIFTIIKEMLMVSSLCNNLVKVDISPSSSCEVVGDSPPNLGNCLQACVSSGRPFYMVSRNVVNNTCLCCMGTPRGLKYPSHNWISYSILCTTGYTEMTSDLTRTCLRYVTSRTNYTSAVLDCREDDGDLIRIDSLNLRRIFLDFIFNYVDSADRVHGEIWIQGIRNANGVWTFHDDSVFPTFMNNYMIETHRVLENYLRYVINKEKLLDEEEDRMPHNFVCEHRFIGKQMPTVYP